MQAFQACSRGSSSGECHDRCCSDELSSGERIAGRLEESSDSEDDSPSKTTDALRTLSGLLGTQLAAGADLDYGVLLRATNAIKKESVQALGMQPDYHSVDNATSITIIPFELQS